MTFNRLVNQILLETYSSINYIQNFRVKVLGTLLNKYATKGSWDPFPDYKDAYNIQPLIDAAGSIAYKQLLKFHKYAVMLNIIELQPISRATRSTIVTFLHKEINTLYVTCKLFLITIMDIRMGWLLFNSEYGSDNEITTHRQVLTLNQYTKYIKSYYHVIDQSINSIGYDADIINCYDMLDSAKSIDEKIRAISLTLNVWHDSSSLMIKDWGESKYGEVIRGSANLPEGASLNINGAPFTIAQLDSLSNIPLRVIEKDLHKLIDDVDILSY